MKPDEIVVVLIAIAAGAWLLRRWVRGAKKSSKCGSCGGCCGCSSKKDAQEE